MKRRHSAAYADAGIARISFGSVTWALDYLLEHGGSAYLPESLVTDHLQTRRLFLLQEGPVFSRQVYLVVNDDSASQWPWFGMLLQDLRCAA